MFVPEGLRNVSQIRRTRKGTDEKKAAFMKPLAIGEIRLDWINIPAAMPGINTYNIGNTAVLFEVSTP